MDFNWKDMKKFFLGILMTCVVISCLGEGENSFNYQLDMTFETVAGWNVKFGSDSLSVVDETGWILGQDPSVGLAYKQKDGQFQGGFRLSRLEGEADGELTRPQTDLDAWRVNAVCGVADRTYMDGSMTYAVLYDNPEEDMMPAHDLEFGYSDIGTCTMYGCYVNNTTLVARKVKEVFADGDKLLLKATGYRRDGTKTGDAEIELAEYSALKDTVMYNWSVFDLSDLGVVDYVDFEVVSSKPEVPSYACIDGILTGIAISY